MTKFKYLATIFLVVFLLITGYLLARMFEVPGIEIQRQVSPIHLLSLLVTLAIAVLLSVFYDKHKESNKVAKSILIKHIEGIYALVDKLSEELSDSQLQVTKAASFGKNLYQSLDSVFHLAEEKGMKLGMSMEEFSELLGEIRTSLTLVPSKGSKGNIEKGRPAPYKAANNIYDYSDGTVSFLHSKLQLLKNKLVKLQISIS